MPFFWGDSSPKGLALQEIWKATNKKRQEEDEWSWNDYNEHTARKASDSAVPAQNKKEDNK